MAMTPNRPEDLWRKVDRSGGADACWPWTAARFADGYGAWHYKGKPLRATHAAWVFTHGPIPEGLKVLHRCDNPPCCNPAHLFLGTTSDNAVDCFSKGRHPLAALTDEAVADIRRRRRAGETALALASEYRVDRHTIASAASGNTHAWVQEPVYVAGVRHGREATYNRHGCRCDECKQAKREARAQYMARRKGLDWLTGVVDVPTGERL